LQTVVDVMEMEYNNYDEKKRKKKKYSVV